ncbi:MAG: DEAD/DEAH box helicase family protein [Chloroflexi bacterium]|nr:DEAD/DEAH box helicase family protein [Chloroflexota bacterium]
MAEASVRLPRIYSSPATRLVVDDNHVILAPELADLLPDHVEVEVQGVATFRASREGELLIARRLGQRLLRLGSLVQMEVADGRLLCRNALVPGDRAEPPDGQTVLSDPSGLIQRLCLGQLCPPGHFFLAREAAALAIKPGFDQVLSLNAVQGVMPYPHQLATVTAVLRRMRGRALLCDEVGLGKTVEAGLVLMEYLLRGLVRRVLILTPSSLLYQWREEMAQKFNLDFILSEAPAFKEAGPAAWTNFDLIIASLSQAKRGSHLETIQRAAFDMVVVDEAHYLRHRETRAWNLVNGLDKKYILLLTATPVQNDLEEIFNLITLLRPGQLQTANEFRKRYITRGDRLQPQNVDELRRLVGQVMVRNRRSTAGIAFTQRHAHTVRVEPTAGEADLRRLVTGLVRDMYPALASSEVAAPTPDEENAEYVHVLPTDGVQLRLNFERRPGPSRRVALRPPSGPGVAGPLTVRDHPLLKAGPLTRSVGSKGAQGEMPERSSGLNRMVLKTLQMELGSSPAAVTPTLERLLSHSAPARMGQRLGEILGVARAVGPTAKLAALLQTLHSLPRDEKVLIFTRYRATLGWLRHQLEGWPVAMYHGGLSAREKDEVVERFRSDTQIMLSTDVGGEGRNLQFCHLLVNFDLPWNPMRIEQRIGRLSRIGQQRDVYIFNLSSAGSIEDHLMEVLDRRINLFELVVGELDLILGRLEDERDLEDIIMELVATSSTDEEAGRRIEELGERLQGLKDGYERVKAVDDALFREVGHEQT